MKQVIAIGLLALSILALAGVSIMIGQTLSTNAQSNQVIVPGTNTGFYGLCQGSTCEWGAQGCLCTGDPFDLYGCAMCCDPYLDPGCEP